MSTYATAFCQRESNRLESHGTEDSSEENNNKTCNPYSKAVRPRLRSENPAGEGRSNSMEQLVRPALPGRKVHGKTCSMDSRGRSREGNRDKDEVRLSIEHVPGRERGMPRLRKTEGSETHGNGAPDRQGKGRTESPSSSRSDIQFNSALETGEGSNLHRGETCPKSQSNGCASTNRAKINPQHCQTIMRSMSSPVAPLSVQTRSTPLSPQRPPPRTITEEHDLHSFRSPRQTDSFWAEVRSGGGTELSSQNHHETQILSVTSLELGEEEEEEEVEEEEEEEDEDEDPENDEEESNVVMAMVNQTGTPASVPPCAPFGEARISKRERNRIKCLRRRQRRRERWRQSHLQDSKQSSLGTPSISSSDEEGLSAGDREGFICAVCLDIYFSPYMCHPCNHIFCEPCLRTLAKNSPTNTPCPLCRTIITHVFFQKELNQSSRTFFPKEYVSRKQNFQKASCAKWPLPSCRKLFRIFGGFQRPSSPISRRQIPHGAGYRLDAMDFRDDSRGWRLDMNMVIIYIFSVNWVIGFFILCFICYVFFPSF